MPVAGPLNYYNAETQHQRYQIAAGADNADQQNPETDACMVSVHFHRKHHFDIFSG
jgi:hypothetical protein